MRFLSVATVHRSPNSFFVRQKPQQSFALGVGGVQCIVGQGRHTLETSTGPPRVHHRTKIITQSHHTESLRSISQFRHDAILCSTKNHTNKCCIFWTTCRSKCRNLTSTRTRYAVISHCGILAVQCRMKGHN